MFQNVNKKLFELDIQGFNSRGDGISRMKDGYVLFVPGALPGEIADVRIDISKKQYAVANILNIAKAHPERIIPACPWYGMCGGCQMQHAAYSLQLCLKETIVRDCMKRIGGLSLPGNYVCEPSPRIWNYRNKASFPVRQGQNGLEVGFFRQKSHDLIPIDYCPILEPSLNSLYSLVVDALKKSGLRGYNESENSGFIRHLVLRTGSFTAEEMICLVLKKTPNRSQMKKIRCIAEEVKKRFPRLKGFTININSSKGNSILGRTTLTILGRNWLYEKLDNFLFQYDSTAFFQINSYQAKRLYQYVAKQSQVEAKSSIMELFSGVGSLTAYLAGKANSVISVEEWPSAVDGMKRNMVKNSFENVSVILGTAEQVVDKYANSKFDVIVVDPPRGGCKPEVLEAILKHLPKRLVYVSCGPSTLARDATILSAGGFELVDIRSFDMFPQTHHVETVATFVPDSITDKR